MLSSFAQNVELLRALGAADIDHSGATLLDHLIRTHAILVDWRVRAPVALAGLFHSVYGTTSFRARDVTADFRAAIRDAVGVETERLAYLFCSMKTRSVFDAALQVDAAGASPADAASLLPLAQRFAPEPIRVTFSTACDLAVICAANDLEQLARMPQEYDESYRRTCLRLLPLLPEPAQRALSRAFGFLP